MSAVVDVVSSIDAHHGNQPNKGKLALYQLLIHFNGCLKHLYTRTSGSSSIIKASVGKHGCIHIRIKVLY